MLSDTSNQKSPPHPGISHSSSLVPLIPIPLTNNSFHPNSPQPHLPPALSTAVSPMLPTPLSPTSPPATPQRPTSPAPPVSSVPAVLRLGAAGAFQDKIKKIKAVKAQVITNGRDAAKRLRLLKDKLNELQERRDRYRKKFTGHVAGGAVAAVLTGGLSAVVSLPAAAHMSGNNERLLEAMRAVISQINQIRAVYSRHPAVCVVEEQVAIFTAVFSNASIERSELNGPL